jgi:membrane-associated phospholipid phosphatase
MNNAVSFTRVARLIGHPWFILLWLGAMLISYVWLDRPLAAFFQQQAGSLTTQIASIITLLGSSKVYFLILGLLWIFARFIKPMPIWKDRSLFLLLCLIIPGLLCLALKMLLGRARPIEWFNHDWYGFYFLETQASFLSMPSGHTVTITSLMFGLCYLFPRHWVSLVSLALIVSASRIIVTAHYLSDIMGGMLLAALTVSWLHTQLVNRNVINLA